MSEHLTLAQQRMLWDRLRDMRSTGTQVGHCACGAVLSTVTGACVRGKYCNAPEVLTILDMLARKDP